MKHTEFEALIFVGTKQGDFYPSVILNNDKELSVRELKHDKYYYKLNITKENIFTVEEAEALQKGELAKPIVRNFLVYKGEDWRRDDIYKEEPIKITFKAIRVNVDVSYFDIDGLN